jgi:hypothetical protein
VVEETKNKFEITNLSSRIFEVASVDRKDRNWRSGDDGF